MSAIDQLLPYGNIDNEDLGDPTYYLADTNLILALMKERTQTKKWIEQYIPVGSTLIIINAVSEELNPNTLIIARRILRKMGIQIKRVFIDATHKIHLDAIKEEDENEFEVQGAIKKDGKPDKPRRLSLPDCIVLHTVIQNPNLKLVTNDALMQYAAMKRKNLESSLQELILDYKYELIDVAEIYKKYAIMEKKTTWYKESLDTLELALAAGPSATPVHAADDIFASHPTFAKQLILCEKGMMLLALKDFDGAIEQAQKIIQLNPDSIDAGDLWDKVTLARERENGQQTRTYKPSTVPLLPTVGTASIVSPILEQSRQQEQQLKQEQLQQQQLEQEQLRQQQEQQRQEWEQQQIRQQQIRQQQSQRHMVWNTAIQMTPKRYASFLAVKTVSEIFTESAVQYPFENLGALDLGAGVDLF